jgi:hypothetical protein
VITVPSEATAHSQNPSTRNLSFNRTDIPNKRRLFHHLKSLELQAECRELPKLWQVAGVCSENPIRVDGALESPKLAE